MFLMRDTDVSTSWTSVCDEVREEGRKLKLALLSYDEGRRVL